MTHDSTADESQTLFTVDADAESSHDAMKRAHKLINKRMALIRNEYPAATISSISHNVATPPSNRKFWVTAFVVVDHKTADSAPVS